tara:strand:+ start:119 stop:1084 length:966 start_codon:yes stop_codon:yes gene_type:complete
VNYKPIIIVSGEPNSIFLEILSKSIKVIKIKSPIILICSKRLLYLQMKNLKSKIDFNEIKVKDALNLQINKKKINLIDVNFQVDKAFTKISSKSNNYIKNCFGIALKLLNHKITNKFINGPISKKFFLKKKFLGVTEYLVNKTGTKKYAMLIYNKSLAVSPLTTHLPLRLVAKEINKKIIKEKLMLINDFYKKNFKTNPKIAVTGLNPHCESVLNFNEDNQIIKPSIKRLSKLKYKIFGPLSADTAFTKTNRKQFDVVFGMYHDQVLTPMKTLYEFDAINITLGLPFLRVSPDHGPNENMLGKNKSNPLSLIKAIEFLDKN